MARMLRKSLSNNDLRIATDASIIEDHSGVSRGFRKEVDRFGARDPKCPALDQLVDQGVAQSALAAGHHRRRSVHIYHGRSSASTLVLRLAAFSLILDFDCAAYSLAT